VAVIDVATVIVTAIMIVTVIVTATVIMIMIAIGVNVKDGKLSGKALEKAAEGVGRESESLTLTITFRSMIKGEYPVFRARLYNTYFMPLTANEYNHRADDTYTRSGWGAAVAGANRLNHVMVL
jgi:hypothetical protein